MLAFAGNSILCRMALASGSIDAVSFTAIRLAAGAVFLWLLVRLRRQSPGLAGSWPAALSLFLYAIFFSYAYLELAAGTGALVLFGLVQATMIAAALLGGDRPRLAEAAGWAVAAAGLVYLLLPGATAPSARGALMMSLAGVAWGVYSILGRGASRPLEATAGNFIRSIAFLALLVPLWFGASVPSGRGVILAIVSGAVTSGAGYVVWYAALGRLRTLEAALVQLSVPAIAAFGGVLLLAEPLTLRLTLASVLILGGIAWALLGKRRPA